MCADKTVMGNTAHQKDSDTSPSSTPPCVTPTQLSPKLLQSQGKSLEIKLPKFEQHPTGLADITAAISTGTKHVSTNKHHEDLEIEMSDVETKLASQTLQAMKDDSLKLIRELYPEKDKDSTPNSRRTSISADFPGLSESQIQSIISLLKEMGVDDVRAQSVQDQAAQLHIDSETAHFVLNTLTLGMMASLKQRREEDKTALLTCQNQMALATKNFTDMANQVKMISEAWPAYANQISQCTSELTQWVSKTTYQVPTKQVTDSSYWDRAYEHLSTIASPQHEKFARIMEKLKEKGLLKRFTECSDPASFLKEHFH